MYKNYVFYIFIIQWTRPRDASRLQQWTRLGRGSHTDASSTLSDASTRREDASCLSVDAATECPSRV